ncbi:MAG: dTDP-4-amino-4,6-dideoxygalactose transaminase [bacterium]|nr:dTDP-4-amino-4,6-dideoxygalactose transaminase [bacterium]
MKSKIPFNKPFIIGNELDYIKKAMYENNHLAGNGPFTAKCQQWIEQRIGCRRALLTHSCTGALEMAAILCGIGNGDEVIMPSFTFVTTASAFALRGAKPVFVDIRPDNLNLDANRLSEAIKPRTRAIVPVHYTGVACDLDHICRIAEAHGLYVIEDSAQGFLSYYKGRALGSIGHVGCLSFHETKNIISGEGGALMVNDAKLLERAEIIWEKGTNRSQFRRGLVDKYTWQDLGSSFAPSELVAAFLWAQLEYAEAICAKRKSLFDRYFERLQPLADAGCFQLPHIPKFLNHSGHIFYILTKSLKERTQLIRFLAAHEIYAVFHFVPLHSSKAGKKYGYARGRMAVTDDASERLLRLPMFYEMTESELDQVVDTFFKFYQ